jgi:hypothetical protein
MLLSLDFLSRILFRLLVNIVAVLLQLLFIVIFLKFGSGRIPVRLYVRSVGEEIVEIEDAPIIDSWDKISYINRPFEIYKEEGVCFFLLSLSCFFLFLFLRRKQYVPLIQL